jgi:hypothetical protein
VLAATEPYGSPLQWPVVDVDLAFFIVPHDVVNKANQFGDTLDSVDTVRYDPEC